MTSTETIWLVFTKFHMMLSVNGGLTVCSYGHALLTKMATINGKKKTKKKNKTKTKQKQNTLKSSFQEPRKL